MKSIIGTVAGASHGDCCGCINIEIDYRESIKDIEFICNECGFRLGYLHLPGIPTHDLKILTEKIFKELLCR